MIEKRWKSMKPFLSACVAVVAIAAAGGVPTVAMAQQCADDSGPSQTMSPAVAKVLQSVYDQVTADQYPAALVELNQLIANRGDSMSPFEKATAYEMRGSIRANQEEYRGALQDFQTALNTNALPVARNNQLRYFIAQLNVQLGDYPAAIRGLTQWIQNSLACGQAVDYNAYYLLAASHVQTEPPNYRAAMDPAEKAIAAAPEPKKGAFDLLNLIYSELKEVSKRTNLLERMIGLWPDQKNYWKQLSALYAEQQRDRDAFTVLEVAYRAGLLSEEGELTSLVQYYSFFNNPYRGAKMLEREMNAGNIKRTQKNLILLSQLWSQAREHKKSIPILREAAQNSGDGELYYRLGMVLLADEQYQAAEAALLQGLNKGGMDSKDTGDAWLLLGTARFSRAGPNDTELWASARRAFVSAQRYPTAARRASDWIAYIDAVADTYERLKKREEFEALKRCRDDLDRIERDQRIRDLQNRGATEEELQRERDVATRCEAILAGEAPAEEAAPAADGDAAEDTAETGDE